jgi:hypothetical protein
MKAHKGMYEVTIPAWTNQKTGEHHPPRSFEAELVEVLLANSPQPGNIILKYYGYNAPFSAFKPSVNDRLVFHCNEYGYIIVPNVARNKKLWRRI